ncbi:MAG: DUF547 domain-containing protein [Acidimicrobiia bacterium]|nr:DUF547 domain-containing protein [Acidimicrobiia bacterium]
MNGPNPIRVAWSMLRNQLTVARPRPAGTGRFDHSALSPPLEALARGKMAALGGLRPALDHYIDGLAAVDPNELSSNEALAFWLNLYNAGALRLAADAVTSGEESVLRVPGAFDGPFVAVAGEHLSLDAIEHAKIRRFGDPRIHSAIVCGSVSCPTLRGEPYDGDHLDRQLEDQMRHFLSSGGASASEGVLLLSRVFLWYGADFVRPGRMPTWLPASPKRVAVALRPWLNEETASVFTVTSPRIDFQPYDWGLRCAIG